MNPARERRARRRARRAATACARTPTVVRQPPWTGRAPSIGTPNYAETFEALQLLFEEYPHALRQQVSAPAPCVLRVVRSDHPFTPNGTAGSVYESTWVDLSRVTELQARSSLPQPGPGPSPGTCASLGGMSRFALHTQIVAAGKGTPARHIELADERSPRVCVGNRAHPERLAAPLRQLVALCGGRTSR
jgi:hypothetical protein